VSSRVLLIAVLSIAALVAAGYGGKSTAKTAAPPPLPYQHFHSRPDIKPPVIRIRTRAHRTAPGLIFLAPKMVVAQAGPMIVDNSGQVVWFDPLAQKGMVGVADFKVQHYHGKPVLTWWRGRAPMGVGAGYYAIYDTAYRQVAQVRAGHGLDGDIHEFLITPRNTAMFTVYQQKHVDLSKFGGPRQGRIFDGIVQEVDIKTGHVLFEWHTYPEIGLNESYVPGPKAAKGPKAAPWDYIHLNSIDVEPNGNLLVSGRNTRALYELDHKGKLLWRLGGKRSDFTLGPGARFAWQHDARRRDDSTITLFDNGAAPPVEKFTRVLVLHLDLTHKRVTLVRRYVHPKHLLVPFEGNAQFLPDGHVFVGWGALPYYSEFDAQGHVLLDAYFGHGKPPLKDADSYRAFRFVWHGNPDPPPTLAVTTRSAYASWNGATDIASWRLLVGQANDDLRVVRTVPKRGFETAIALPTNGRSTRYVAVEAIGHDGRVLGTSQTVKR
jgi:arylsulfotransferase ASST